MFGNERRECTCRQSSFTGCVGIRSHRMSGELAHRKRALKIFSESLVRGNLAN